MNLRRGTGGTADAEGISKKNKDMETIKLIAEAIYFYVMFSALFGCIYGFYLKITKSKAWKRFKESQTMDRIREKKIYRRWKSFCKTVTKVSDWLMS